jgi:hypothetical protein
MTSPSSFVMTVPGARWISSPGIFGVVKDDLAGRGRVDGDAVGIVDAAQPDRETDLGGPGLADIYSDLVHAEVAGAERAPVDAQRLMARGRIDELKTAQAIGAGLDLTDFHDDSRERTPLHLEHLTNQPGVLRGGLDKDNWCSERTSNAAAGPIKTRCGSLCGGNDWTVGSEPTGVG